MRKLTELLKTILKQPRRRLIAGTAIVAIAGVWLLTSGSKSNAKTPMFAARRGPLEITVLEEAASRLWNLRKSNARCESGIKAQKS